MKAGRGCHVRHLKCISTKYRSCVFPKTARSTRWHYLMVFFQTYLKESVTCFIASCLTCKYCTAPITTASIRLFAINVLNWNQLNFECAGAKYSLHTKRKMVKSCISGLKQVHGWGTLALHMTKTPLHFTPKAAHKLSLTCTWMNWSKTPKNRHLTQSSHVIASTILKWAQFSEFANKPYSTGATWNLISHSPSQTTKSPILHQDQLNVRKGRDRCKLLSGVRRILMSMRRLISDACWYPRAHWLLVLYSSKHTQSSLKRW